MNAPSDPHQKVQQKTGTSQYAPEERHTLNGVRSKGAIADQESIEIVYDDGYPAGYTIMDNRDIWEERYIEGKWVIRPTFSPRAFMAWSGLISLRRKKKQWSFNFTDIRDRLGMGRDTLRAALAELEAKGRLERLNIRKPDGTYGLQRWVLHPGGRPCPPPPTPPTPPTRENPVSVRTDASKGVNGPKTENQAPASASAWKSGNGPATENQALASTGSRKPDSGPAPDAKATYCTVAWKSGAGVSVPLVTTEVVKNKETTALCSCVHGRIYGHEFRRKEMEYSIDQFWRPQFASIYAQTPSATLPGWHAAPDQSPAFVEAALSLRPDHNDLSQNVWLIAAPGAVGKSTLAKEICAATNAVYLDLAAASTVAGNYLVGGLVKSGLWGAWQASQSTLLIDALDEARLRVTQSSFEDFLADVANVAGTRAIPVVLLGRVGIVEEAWAILNEKSGLNPPIFDIELFQPPRAKTFVRAAIKRLAKAVDSTTGKRTYPHLEGALASHQSVYERAATSLVDHLTAETSADGRQFAGYAPVLEALATVIASESNPAKIDDAIESIFRGQVLGRVTSEVMVREASKLSTQLAATVSGVNPAGLYDAKEQLSRLASLVLGAGSPQLPSNLPQHAVAAYEEAVQSLLPQHPFLDSRTQKPAGAVFGACILAAALTGDDTNLALAAQRFASGGSNTPNPFLLTFYKEALAGQNTISAEHVGLLYASLEATAGAGESVRLNAEGDDSLEVEMSLLRNGDKEETYEFLTIPGSELRFGRRIGGVTVDAEGVDAELGDGGQLELIAPFVMKVRNLMLNCGELVVKPDNSRSDDQVVYLEAAQAVVDSGLRPPTVRHGAKLQVAWPESKVYPWTPFASTGGEDLDPRIADAQRALRRLCISFRSHSKGRLARYKGKVEHFRMTKGSLGIALRQRLVADKVLSLEGAMYFLEPNVLGDRVGVSFQDLKLKHYSPQSRAYLQSVLDGLE